MARPVILLAAMGALLLSGCSAAAAPRGPDQAAIFVKVGADGSLRIDLRMPPSLSRPDLARVGRAVAAGLYGGQAGVRGGLRRPRFGDPVATVSVSNAYRPGARPAVTVDLAALQRVLAAEGIRRTSLSVCGPRVNSTINAIPDAGAGDGRFCASWAQAQSLQTVTVSMRPDVGVWLGQIALIGLTVAADVLALCLLGVGRVPGFRRRACAILLAVLSLCGSLAGIVTGAGGAGDNLGVHGDLAGAALRTATDLPLVVLVGWLVPVALAVAAPVARRSRVPAHIR